MRVRACVRACLCVQQPPFFEKSCHNLANPPPRQMVIWALPGVGLPIIPQKPCIPAVHGPGSVM